MKAYAIEMLPGDVKLLKNYISYFTKAADREEDEELKNTWGAAVKMLQKRLTEQKELL